MAVLQADTYLLPCGTMIRPLLLFVLLLFQSHWVDDVLTTTARAEPDTAGIIVSAIGSALLLPALFAPRALLARIAAALGLAFTAFISVADLVGLKADGSRAPNIPEHWHHELGVPIAATVLLTLLGAVTGLIMLRFLGSRRRARARDRPAGRHGAMIGAARPK
jgi:hypothetical protein